GGTLALTADANIDNLIGTAAGTVLLGGFKLTTGAGGGTASYPGTITGPGALGKSGTGTQTLTGTNTATAGTVSHGTRQWTTARALGAAAPPVTAGTLGTLLFSGSTTSSREFDLTGTLKVAATVTLTLDSAVVAGGFLRGPGTISTTTTGASQFVGA